MADFLTGGCQCGAVRYRVEAPFAEVSICHCRMCQKATGGPFGAFAIARLGSLTWTHGEPAAFRSSARAERLFCRDCGTPLAFRTLASGKLDVTIGTLDEPGRAIPTSAIGAESKLAWVDRIAALPEETTEAWLGRIGEGRVTSYQHPDREAGSQTDA